MVHRVLLPFGNDERDLPPAELFSRGGTRRVRLQLVMCLPCEEFLLALTPEHFPE
jgi:hypothetical protein